MGSPSMRPRSGCTTKYPTTRPPSGQLAGTTAVETRSDITMTQPTHPGEVLREDVLAERGLSVREAAVRLGISRATLSRVLRGQAPLSANLALRLECAGVSTARAWLAMQVAHDLAVVRATETPRVRRLDELD
jgi:addiction module HigA family antidote